MNDKNGHREEADRDPSRNPSRNPDQRPDQRPDQHPDQRPDRHPDHDEVRTTRWSSDRAEDRFTVDDPATGRRLAVVQGAGDAEVDGAVRAAHQGFLSWSRRTPVERGRLLLEVAGKIRSRAGELAELESRENGKPYSQALFDLEACVACFELFAGLTHDLPGSVRDSGYALDVTSLQPFGVIGGIIPFNWPPIHTAGKTAPALAAGNAVVLKPPEQAPLTVMRLAGIIQSVLPDDVVHVVPGKGSVGAALAGHPLVRKLSFTGAPTTGSAVLRTAATHLTPTLMELGGKNPLVIFEDADLDAAVAGAVEGGYFNQGEACTAASRLLVHRSVHDEVVHRLGRAVAGLRVGRGLDEATHVGPLVTRAQQQRVLEYLRIGVEEGAEIAAQAPLPTDPDLKGGFYVPPTLLTGVRPDMRVAKEEIFGPVVCVIPFDDEAEAVEIANGTDFGLVASVYTADSGRALRVGRAIEAGVVFVNNYNRAMMGTPFGGTKHSGYGREHAAETLREFSYSKTVRLPSGTRPIPRWSAVADVLG
ncbi:aldehyde dehydrogenase family protein [Streptomyces sp. NPDC004610]|uniref:aldehyde dehydrogenase family protein n=1 Tax=unclassified Streptomyces TaxID=2593676 RepID=UPI0033BDBCAB